jgi:hypothetical protein
MKRRPAIVSGVRPSVSAGLAAALLFFSGCRTQSYVLQVDAISQPPPIAVAPRAAAAKSFKVRASNPRTEEDSLRYKEVSDYVKTALSGKGLYEAPTAESADLIIEIDYGVETPRMRYETVKTPVVVSSGTMPNREVALLDNDNRNRALSRVIRRDQTEVVIVYEKFLKVSARENQETVAGRPPPEVWSVNVSAEDESQELRKYLPILASATADYIGTNTKQEKAVAVHEGDETVQFIKRGM